MYGETKMRTSKRKKIADKSVRLNGIFAERRGFILSYDEQRITIRWDDALEILRVLDVVYKRSVRSIGRSSRLQVKLQ